MRTAAIQGLPPLLLPVVSRRMGIEREVSDMEQDERLSAGPQSTQQPVPEAEQRRRERLLRAREVLATRSRWKVDQNAVGAEILWNLMRITIGLALFLVVGAI